MRPPCCEPACSLWVGNRTASNVTLTVLPKECELLLPLHACGKCLGLCSQISIVSEPEDYISDPAQQEV